MLTTLAAMVSGIGLVEARVEGHYYIYALQTDVLRRMAQELLHKETLPRLSGDAGQADAFERKVLAAFTDADGRITAFPAQEKKFQVLLDYVAKAFEPGKRYPEKVVNEILARFNEDTAQLRRSLVETHRMEREGGGGEYWKA